MDTAAKPACGGHPLRRHGLGKCLRLDSARSISFWTGKRSADWKAASHFVNMRRLLGHDAVWLPFGGFNGFQPTFLDAAPRQTNH